MYFSPRCLFCDKNNGRRHTRRGRTWQCKHCGEMNPGPGMLKAIVGRFTAPAADAHTNGATQPVPAKVAATTIKGVAKAPAAKPSAKPASAIVAKSDQPASKPQPKPLTPPTPPPAKRGVLEGIAARVYG